MYDVPVTSFLWSGWYSVLGSEARETINTKLNLKKQIHKIINKNKLEKKKI